MVKQKLWRLMSYTLLLAMISSVLILSGCSDDDDGGDNNEPFDGTMLELIASDEFKQSEGADPDMALDSLNKYLDAYPDLKAALSGSTEYTFFAPSNTAFISLLATPGFPADIRDINPDIIKGVLSYHIIPGVKDKDAVCAFGATGVATLYTQPDACGGAGVVQVIKSNDDCTLLTGSTTTNIVIEEADREASNGVVHLTRSVLIPPSVGASLTPILGKLSAVVLLGADFKYLAQVIRKADCGTDETDIAAILSSAGPFTAFLPADAVFEGTAAGWPGGAITVQQLIDAFTAAQWRAILLNHVVAGSNNFASLENTEVLTTSLNANAKLTVAIIDPAPAGTLGKFLTTSGAGTGLPGSSNAPIVVKDIAVSNGTAHVVGKILFPN